MAKDIALFNILSNNLLAVAREMSADMLRSAYSTVIREAADASTFLADSKGRVLAQSQNIPLHMNSVSSALTGALRVVDVSSLTEDDVIILNDPYNGGQHQSDVYLFSPVVEEGKLVAFSGSAGHHADLGHSAGFNLYARDIFEERFRFTPMKFSLSKDWNGGILEQILRANLRLPKDTIGDFNAQLVANETGRRRIHGFVKRYGYDAFMEVSEQLLDYAERAMRTAIAQVPDGEYFGECMADDDGIHEEPIIIRVKITVAGDTLQVDYSGTSPQVVTAINCPIASTVSATYSALKMILTDPTIPINDGAYRPIQVTAPKGCILNPKEFAPVEGRNIIIMRVFQSILKAFEDVLPERVPAQGYDQRTEINLQWAGEDSFVAISDELGGGYGAGMHNDGADLIDDPLGNCKNSPVESLEIAQKFFRILRYDLRPDSGGAGKSRGGLGAIREYEFLKDQVDMTFYSDRFKYPARGARGGQDGACAYLKIFRKDGTVEAMRAKGHAVLHAGDRVEMALGGGAGYGNPLERSREKVARDIACKKVSPEKARELYGYQE